MEQKEMLALLKSQMHMTYAERNEIAVHMNALSERLHQQEADIEKFVQERGTMKASSPTMEWISVEDKPFPRLKGGDDKCYLSPEALNSYIVYCCENNGIVSHWMRIEPPKPKVSKYIKKPIVVEGYQTEKEMVIHTLEGDMTARPGDYIITGVKGEQYPCKPDVFEMTYEPYFEEEGVENGN